MTALSAGTDIRPAQWLMVDHARIASGATIFDGAALNFSNTGGLVAATNSATDNGFAGWARAAYDNSAATTAMGPLVEFGIPASCDMALTWSQANGGKNAYIADDATTTTTAGNGIFIGVITRVGRKSTSFTRVSPIIPRIA